MLVLLCRLNSFIRGQLFLHFRVLYCVLRKCCGTDALGPELKLNRDIVTTRLLCYAGYKFITVAEGRGTVNLSTNSYSFKTWFSPEFSANIVGVDVERGRLFRPRLVPCTCEILRLLFRFACRLLDKLTDPRSSSFFVFGRADFMANFREFWMTKVTEN